jgi:hypothetical protein
VRLPMFIAMLPAVSKVVAKECAFARDFCNPKSPVKPECLGTAQNLGFLQIRAEGNL